MYWGPGAVLGFFFLQKKNFFAGGPPGGAPHPSIWRMIMRITRVALSLLTLVGLAGAASAQTTGTTGTANASNSVTVNAYTGTGNGTTGTDGTSGTSGTGTTGSAGSTTTNVHYSGHEWSTPSVQGSYFAGANPCLVGIGGSGAGGPIGLSFTFGRSDDGCQRRSDAAAWHALGHDEVAVARMCQDDDNRTAFEAVGYVCPQTRVKLAAAAVITSPTSSRAVEAGQQAPVSPQQIPSNQSMTGSGAPAAAGTQVMTKQPDWCSAVTGLAERLRYKQACSF
jgi:hypothetical protein